MRSKLSKIVVSILLIVSMVIPNIALKANAADTETTDKKDSCTIQWMEVTNPEVVKKHLEEDTCPEYEVEGYLFGGWYKEEKQEKASALKAGEEPTGTTYALFVPDDVLGVMAQVSAQLIDGKIADADKEASIRFVTSIPSLCFKEVGLNVTYTGSKGQVVTSSSATNKETKDIVYKSLYQVDSMNEVREERPWTLFCGASQYFKAHTITNVPDNFYETEFKVQPYWVTLQGQTVTAKAQTKKILDGAVATKGELNLVHSFISSGTMTKTYDIATNVGDFDLTLKGAFNNEIFNTKSGEGEKFEIEFTFPDNKEISFVLKYSASKWKITDNNKGNTNSIYYSSTTTKQWVSDLNQYDEQYDGEASAFRIYRAGTEVYVYWGDTYLTTVDLTNNNSSGVTATTKIDTVRIKHHGVATAAAKEEYTDGDNFTVNVPFVLYKTGYITKDCDLSRTIAKADYDAGKVRSIVLTEVTEHALKDFDLSINVKRDTRLKAAQNGDNYEITLEFANANTNENTLAFSLNYVDGAWKIVNNTSKAGEYATAEVWYALTSDEYQKYLNTGIDLHIKRQGTKIDLYFDGKLVKSDIDLTKISDDITADTTIQKVNIKHRARFTTAATPTTDSFDLQLSIPYTLSRTVESITP